MPSNNSIDLSSFKLVAPINTRAELMYGLVPTHTLSAIPNTYAEAVSRRLTQERLKELLRYDPETGKFYWRVHRGGRSWAGMEAGNKRPDGYRQIKIDGVLNQSARLAWLYVYGTWPKECVDHINGVRDDDRISNLREATKYENQQNSGHYSSNTSGYRGVHYNKTAGKWQSNIQVNKKLRFLGYFDNPQDAHQAYLTAKAKLHKFQSTPREQ